MTDTASRSSGVLENFGDLWRAEEKIYRFSGVKLFWPVPEAAVRYAFAILSLLFLGGGLPVVGQLFDAIPMLFRLGGAVVVGLAGAFIKPDGRAFHQWLFDRARMVIAGGRLVSYRRVRWPLRVRYDDIPVLSDGRSVALRAGIVKAGNSRMIVRFRSPVSVVGNARGRLLVEPVRRSGKGRVARVSLNRGESLRIVGAA